MSVFQFFSVSVFRQALCALPLAWLWFVLINDLRVEWTVNPQYSYGWAVPFLCLFLLWQRSQKSVVIGQWSVVSSQKSVVSSRRSVVSSQKSVVIGQKPEVSSRRVEAGESAGKRFQISDFRFQLLFVFLALLYAPTRLIEEANPGWRLVSWALAIEVIGLTLIFIRLALGGFPLRLVRGEDQGEVSGPSSLSAFQRFSVSDFVFPVCFFLVAVPWPSHIEMPLIQGLTRLDTGITTELLGWFGIPAMPHGNVIEVATGVVGIDEACSGIRSFQATLMISLFLGEFYRLSVFRRSVLCLAGFALSFLFNLARMSLLVWVAARKGVAAIASWHDPAGVTILVACFFCLWGMGIFLKGKRLKAKGQNEKAEKLPGEIGDLLEYGIDSTGQAISRAKEDGGQKPEDGGQEAEAGSTSPRPSPQGGEGELPSTFNFQLSTLRKLALALGTWIVISEVGIEAWYRSHEARVPVAAQWMVAWPVNNPTFKELPLAGTTRQILRYDEGRSAAWQESNLTWQAVFLRWKPGRTAIHMAQNHTPEVCMTAAGYTLNAISPQEWIEVNGLRMPFLAYQVTDAPQPFFVFYCLWDDRASAQGFETMGLTYGNRLAPVLAGLRNPGQRSLEIAVVGPDNATEAGAAVRAELEKLIRSE